MSGTKRERITKVLARVELACELLDVIVPRVIELAADVRVVLDLDRLDAGEPTEQDERNEPAVRRAP